jgi:hypothetical protein
VGIYPLPSLSVVYLLSHTLDLFNNTVIHTFSWNRVDAGSSGQSRTKNLATGHSTRQYGFSLSFLLFCLARLAAPLEERLHCYNGFGAVILALPSQMAALE